MKLLKQTVPQAKFFLQEGFEPANKGEKESFVTYELNELTTVVLDN